MVHLAWVVALLFITASAGPLDPLVQVIEGFYNTYTEEPFNVTACLPDALQSDLIFEVTTVADDFINENSFAVFFSHAYILSEYLREAATGCNLVPVYTYVSGFVAKEGWGALAASVEKSEVILEGVAIQTLQDLLTHSWETVGSDIATGLALIVPPQIN